MPCLARACIKTLSLARCAPAAPLRPPVSPLPRLRLLLLPRDVWRRCYAQPATNGNSRARGGDDAKKQAETAVKNEKHYQIAERVIIYHAGTGRITFLAMLKLTSIFIGAFFCFIAVPTYIKADKPTAGTVGIALCGIMPLAFVASTAAPFVTHIHIHLPPSARVSRTALERFVRAMPPSTPLTLTTMSAIGKPRYSSLNAGDLLPAGARRRRFGLVNYVRDTTRENAARKWYNLRAVGKFYVQEKTRKKGGGAKRYQVKKSSMVDAWIWDVVKEKIASRAAAATGSS
ncbi:hypothetical protein HRG_001250 [Hirsutella rhossiliensis]|uniref:4-coumarate-CoA ligase 2 n=1 Tax=Hirsutella rhossiliensis TaxID=111463 RepID=A0A9P8N6N1_9HYPO|nr:4-coumarate-CoA ligase 2 [Hirsutella rhossiliensis]KAH0968608.1 4-coumarate-CoA ligase 2 [Hirsutella rhossiliensis]